MFVGFLGGSSGFLWFSVVFNPGDLRFLLVSRLTESDFSRLGVLSREGNLNTPGNIFKRFRLVFEPFSSPAWVSFSLIFFTFFDVFVLGRSWVVLGPSWRVIGRLGSF